MVRFPWSRSDSVIEVGTGKGYRKESVSEDAMGLQVVGYQYSGDVIRLPHPVNMDKYELWGNDPEASVALNVLTNIIAGVGYYTEMPDVPEAKRLEANAPVHKSKTVVDKYGADINLDEDLQTITHIMLHKGFCPVEVYESDVSQYDLRVLPPESFYKYVNRKGEVVKYTQERSLGDVLAEWKTPEEIESIIVFYFGWTPNRPYGKGLVEPIGPLLDARQKMNVDVPKAVHRWAYPIPIMESSGPKADIQKVLEDRDVDEWLVFGNTNDGELRWKTLEINPQARFINYIELVYYQICEGLHAPLLLYLKNATEASATVMMESVDRLVNGVQRYEKRRVEKYLFEPQVGTPVPRFMWGQLKTGLEDVTLQDLSAIMPYLAKNQQQHILKLYMGNLPLPDWKESAEINKTLNPLPQTPFGQQPFGQPKDNKLDKQTEQLIAGLNNVDWGLKIIETNFREGRIPITEASRLAERTIKAHLQKSGVEDWEKRSEDIFQTFISERLLVWKNQVIKVDAE